MAKNIDTVSVLENEKNSLGIEYIDSLLSGEKEISNFNDAMQTIKQLNNLDIDSKKEKKVDILILTYFSDYLENANYSNDVFRNNLSNIEGYISEMSNEYNNENTEVTMLLKELRKQINMIPGIKKLRSQDLSKYHVNNENGGTIEVSFSRSINRQFDINSDLNNSIKLSSSNDDIPFDMNIDINRRNHDEMNGYDFDYDIIKDDNVSVYKKKYDGNGGITQTYYSYKKNGEIYMGVLGFNFDDFNGEFNGFKFTNKKIEGRKDILSEKELKDYQDKVYYSSIFDSDGYTLENDTIMEFGNIDVGTDEETYKKLCTKYPNKSYLDSALKLVGQSIANNIDYRNHFDIGAIDKGGVGTGDMFGAVITFDGLDNSNLIFNLDNYYEIFTRNNMSPYEIKRIEKDMNVYSNIEQLSVKDKLAFYSDVDSSLVIGDNKDSIIGEKAPYSLLQGLSNEKLENKIDEIISFGGEYSNNPYIKKQLFWRGLERLPIGSAGLTKFLSESKSLDDIIKEQNNYEQEFKKEFLREYLGSNIDEFNIKVDKKFEQLKNNLPKDLKDNKTFLHDLKNSIEYSGLSFVMIERTSGNDTLGGSANFESSLGLIDNLSLGFVDNKGDKQLGLSLSKTFVNYESEKATSSVSGSLVNFMYPLINLSGSYDFNNIELENWTDTNKKVSGMIGTSFPVPFGSLSYNFSNAESIEKRNEALSNFLDDTFSKILENGSINIDEYSENSMKKHIISSIQNILERLDVTSFTDEDKKIIYDDIKESFLMNYNHLNIESNVGSGLSEVGLIYAVLPLVYATYETIASDYELSKDAPGDISEGLESMSNGSMGESISINNFEDLNEYLSNIDGLSFQNGYLVIDENNLSDGTILSFSDELSFKKLEEGKILVGGSIPNIRMLNTNIPGSYANMIVFGDSVMKGSDGESINYLNFVGKNKNGKIENNLKYSSDIETLSFSSSYETSSLSSNNELKEARERFKNSELYGYIDDGIDGSIFIGEDYDGIIGEYEKLVSISRTYDYDKALDYISNTMLDRLPGSNYTALSLFIYKRLGQEKLDDMRSRLDDVLNNGSEFDKKVVFEKIINNFFLDEHIKIKNDYENIRNDIMSYFDNNDITIGENQYILPDSYQNKLGINGNINIGDELYFEAKLINIGDTETANIMHKWYIARMSMKDFDTTDLVEKEYYNRASGFARSLRDEIFGQKYSTFEGNLVISGEEDLKLVLQDAKNLIETNELPFWADNLTQEEKGKLSAFYSIMLENSGYINSKEFETNNTYNTVEVNNVIAFPYTYKLAVDNEHGHVPISGMVEMVDKNGDGVFDQNDYKSVEGNLEIKEYMYNMLSDTFKESLKNVVFNKYGVSLNSNEIKELFLENTLLKNGKRINLNYNIIFTKWGECFNSTLGIKDITLGGNKLGITATSGQLFLSNTIDSDINNYTAALGYEDDKKSEEPEDPEEPEESSGTPGGSTSEGGQKEGGGDSVNGW